MTDLLAMAVTEELGHVAAGIPLLGIAVGAYDITLHSSPEHSQEVRDMVLNTAAENVRNATLLYRAIFNAVTPSSNSADNGCTCPGSVRETGKHSIGCPAT